MSHLILELGKLAGLIVMGGVILRLGVIEHPEWRRLLEKEIVNRRATGILLVSCIIGGYIGYRAFSAHPSATAGSSAPEYVIAYVLAAAIPQIMARLLLFKLGVQYPVQCIIGVLTLACGVPLAQDILPLIIR